MDRGRIILKCFTVPGSTIAAGDAATSGEEI